MSCKSKATLSLKHPAVLGCTQDTRRSSLAARLSLFGLLSVLLHPRTHPSSPALWALLAKTVQIKAWTEQTAGPRYPARHPHRKKKTSGDDVRSRGLQKRKKKNPKTPKQTTNVNSTSDWRTLDFEHLKLHCCLHYCLTLMYVGDPNSNLNKIKNLYGRLDF